MTSFGKYFDDQHESIVKAMQNKNKQQNVPNVRNKKSYESL